MASVPDDAGPGYMDNIADAYNQGHSFDDISSYHAEAGVDSVPQPSLDKAMTGEPLTSSDDYKLAPTIGQSLTREGINPDDFYGSAIGGTIKAVGEMALTGWIHGAGVAMTEDSMQAGRSLWLTQNPGVAKNAGNILHDVELRPGASTDITESLANKSPLQQQQTIYDTVQSLQLRNPDNIRYVDAYITDTGPVRVALNQRQAVLRMARRR